MSANGSTKLKEIDMEGSTYTPSYKIDPTKFRDVIQTSINHVVNREIDIVNAFKGKTIDGRFFDSFPAERSRLKNAAGRPYFIIGSSPVTCAFVAAP